MYKNVIKDLSKENKTFYLIRRPSKIGSNSKNIYKEEYVEISIFDNVFTEIGKKIGTLWIIFNWEYHNILFRFFFEKKCFTHEISLPSSINEELIQELSAIIKKNLCFYYENFLSFDYFLMNNYEAEILQKKGENFSLIKIRNDRSKIDVNSV